MQLTVSVASVLAVGLLLVSNGCRKSGQEDAALTVPKDPKQAASQLQQAFVTANPEVKKTAEVASEALRTADYEKAVQSLQAIKARENLTFEQGMTIHNSMVALEARLISAADGGDANAKRAYEQLKKSRRN
jgi:hypothetical protein